MRLNSSATWHAVAVALVLSLLAIHAQAGQYVYPKEGQSPERQQRDEYDCHVWAVGQTGFDPLVTTPQQPQQASAPAPSKPARGQGLLRGMAQGYVVGKASGGDTSDATLAGGLMGASAAGKDPCSSAGSGMVRGAGSGWIVGKAAGGDSGDAALTGAVMGGLGSARTKAECAKRQQAQTAQQQASQSEAARQQDYQRARTVCLEAKGYAVK